MSTVAVVDYGSGNLRSVAKAFARMAAETRCDAEIQVSADPHVVAAADRVVLPGVGAFADCRQGLANIDGMQEALTQSAIVRGRPFLGICVGMQLMATVGREHEVTPGLDWIAGEIVALSVNGANLKVPHMGWNELTITEPSHPVLTGFGPAPHAYFVHSYHYQLHATDCLLANTDYGGTVAAVVGRDNLLGTQFHPEKSQATGLRLIANFLSWQP